MAKKTVHLIANSHIDPVWLWNKESGIDELLNTSRTMCDLLDEFSDFRFTAAEAYRYWLIEKIDKKLFERIRKHVKNERWEIVGGWWLQPDCNTPTYEGLYNQIKTGYDYLIEKFGFFPEVGYNVDSFGHSAILPELLNKFSQKYYVFMRPSNFEFPFPNNIFVWSGVNKGKVTALRITGGGYGLAHTPHLTEVVPQLISELPDGEDNAALFYGTGDHGGGPTVQMIDYIRKNKNSIHNVELKFSSLINFFKSLNGEHLKVHEGELQYHAIGCYSVKRDIKVKGRMAEECLTQLTEADDYFEDEKNALLINGWRTAAFAQFHDILGGTSIKSAYENELNALGGVISGAKDILNNNLRIKTAEFPPMPYQRIAIDNKSALDFSDYIEFEPWLPWNTINEHQWVIGNKIIDLRDNKDVAYQSIKSEQINENTTSTKRILFKSKLKKNDMAIFSLVNEPCTELYNDFTAKNGRIEHKNGNAVDLNCDTIILSGYSVPISEFHCIDDETDNWSHDIDYYPEYDGQEKIKWDNTSLLENGPLRASLHRKGILKNTAIQEKWSVYEDGQYIELKLKIDWHDERSLLKYTIPIKLLDYRLDGIAGGTLTRENDKKERPFHYFTVLNDNFAIISPDIFAFDAGDDRIRLTLLRNPVLTHHQPNNFDERYAVYSDSGEHTFTIRFTSVTDPQYLSNIAKTMLRPLIFAETTIGMKRK